MSDEHATNEELPIDEELIINKQRLFRIAHAPTSQPQSSE